MDKIEKIEGVDLKDLFTVQAAALIEEKKEKVKEAVRGVLVKLQMSQKEENEAKRNFEKKEKATKNILEGIEKLKAGDWSQLEQLSKSNKDGGKKEEEVKE